MSKLYDILSRYQGFFLGAAIFLSLTAVSFQVENLSIELIFRDNPFTAVLLLGFALLGAWIYIAIDKWRIRQLSDKIVEKSKNENGFQNKLETLTQRQWEIYHLILEGKSNKLICTELYIEPSTLKTHINQLYKKLEVSTRNQLKSRSKH